MAEHGFDFRAFLGAATLAISVAGCDAGPDSSGYQRDFGIAQCSPGPTGRNTYFILEPGYQVVLEGGGARLQITVLDETRTIEGIVTRVVEEREWDNGQLSEVARNYFAICAQSKDVYYFGEDVDFYKNGKVTGHAGTWPAGKDGAKAGLMMPSAPRAGMKYFQEIAPGVAMDRAEIVNLDETCETPAGTFAKCLKTRELSSLDFWSSLKFWATEDKFYAPGIGLILEVDPDGNRVELVSMTTP